MEKLSAIIERLDWRTRIEAGSPIPLAPKQSWVEFVDEVAKLKPHECYVVHVPDGVVANNVVAGIRHTLRARYGMSMISKKDRVARTVRIWNLGVADAKVYRTKGKTNQ